MDTREIMLLAEERGNDGQKTNAVQLINGFYYHVATGKRIIAVDTMYRNCNGVTDRSTGSSVPVLAGVLPLFRIYRNGPKRIDVSPDLLFDYDQIAFRFINKFKMGIPTNVRSCFVTLQGVAYNAIS